VMNKAKVAIVAAVVVLVAVVALPAGAGSGNITGYPTKIARVNLSGYKLQTFYPLGTNAVNTFDQNYLSSNHVSAVGVKGPGKGLVFTSKYIAMPVGHKLLMVTWYLAKGTITDVFVMNFATGIVSDVAPNKKPQSLGTVKIMKAGPHAIP
jgi:hypothetical protein